MVLVLGLGAAAEEVVRTWTSTDGKTVEATLKAYNGETVTLERNGREFDLPVSKLSLADREFLLAHTEAERAAQLAQLQLGSFEMPLQKKMFSDPEDYYDSRIGKSVCEALENEGEDPLALVSSSPEDERAAVYVPEHYDGISPYGVYLHISPMPGPNMPNYQSVLSNRNLIMASPANAGNEVDVMRRIMMALDTVATLKEMYNIDPKRIYVGGLSGGGITAMQAQLIYPELWAGTISHSRGMNLGRYGEYFSETRCFDEGDFKKMSHMDQRFAVISGPNDFNYDHCRTSSLNWEEEGYDIRFFDVDGMGHDNAPLDSFKEALDWVCAVKPFGR